MSVPVPSFSRSPGTSQPSFSRLHYRNSPFPPRAFAHGLCAAGSAWPPPGHQLSAGVFPLLASRTARFGAGVTVSGRAACLLSRAPGCGPSECLKPPGPAAHTAGVGWLPPGPPARGQPRGFELCALTLQRRGLDHAASISATSSRENYAAVVTGLLQGQVSKPGGEQVLMPCWPPAPADRTELRALAVGKRQRETTSLEECHCVTENSTRIVFLTDHLTATLPECISFILSDI